MVSNREGRVLGGLLLVHLATGLVLPYVLLNAAIAPPGFLENAAAHSASVRLAAMLFVLAAALVVAIAVAARPVFRARAERLSMALVALAAANVGLQLVESGTLLTMLSLSQRFATASATETPVLQVVGTAAAAARRWAHYTQLLAVVSWLFLLYLMLWRTAFVPRAMAVAGMVATLLQIAGVPARMMLGYAPIVQLAMPLAPVHLTLAVWLIVRGLRFEPVPREAVAGSA